MICTVSSRILETVLDAGMLTNIAGAWDMDDSIGNIVQGHVNLTEIKTSIELLWRNHVRPDRVLGFGS